MELERQIYELEHEIEGWRELGCVKDLGQPNLLVLEQGLIRRDDDLLVPLARFLNYVCDALGIA
jgi:hypothetical protein